MTKPRMIIVVAVLALVAAGAGLMFSGALGKSTSKQKLAPAWVMLTDPFVVNLADTSGDMHYAKLSVSLEPGPMSASDRASFMAKDANASQTATNPMVGPDNIAVDPVIRSAIVDAVSSFTVAQILSDKDRIDLKTAILQKIQAAEQGELARVPRPDRKPGMSPFDIQGVLITDFAIQ